jgi:hypothetical protein
LLFSGRKMDFDIGNLFYVVITLVAVIVGLVGRKRKSSARGTVPGGTENQPRPGFLDSLEQVLTMGQEEPPVMDLRDYEPDLTGEGEVKEEEIQTETVLADDPQVTPSYMEEYERVLGKLQSREANSDLSMGSVNLPIEVISLEDDEGTNYLEIIRNFDAGTAVVYSAILNRLDY